MALTESYEKCSSSHSIWLLGSLDWLVSLAISALPTNLSHCCLGVWFTLYSWKMFYLILFEFWEIFFWTLILLKKETHAGHESLILDCQVSCRVEGKSVKAWMWGALRQNLRSRKGRLRCKKKTPILLHHHPIWDFGLISLCLFFHLGLIHTFRKKGSLNSVTKVRPVFYHIFWQHKALPMQSVEEILITIFLENIKILHSSY